MGNSDPPEERPNVLIVGGFATIPPNYWPMAARLRRRGARLSVAPIWPPDWAIAALVGFGPIMRRVRRAILRAYLDDGRRPVIVIAHSGGGIVARLAMSAAPFHGRVGGVAEAVGCLVTLGTPHGLARLTNPYWHAGHEACSFLDRESPGAFFAPRTRYLTVGSNYQGTGLPSVVSRALEQFFSIAVGQETAAAGDGIVPASVIHLEGAQQLTLSATKHGTFGSPWYGDERVIDEWWPSAERLWREALETRAAAQSGPVAGVNERKALEFEVAGWSSGSSSGS